MRCHSVGDVNMPSTVSQSIQGTLTQRAGGAPDAPAVVDAVSRTWQFMAAQLEPVIGERGVVVVAQIASEPDKYRIEH